MKRINRRTLLLGTTALGLSAFGRSFAKSRPLNVVVVGGGIVGASIAMHLAKSGARVTLLEKSGPAQGATQNSFAWVNAFVEDKHYRDVRLKSLLAYRDLDKSLALNMVWGGYLDWAAEPSQLADLHDNISQMADTPYPLKNLTAREVSALDPKLAPGNILEAAFSSIDAHLDPVFVTRRFLEQAATLGANIVYPCEVQGIELRGGRLASVASTRGKFPADRMVIAAGVDTPKILAMVSQPLKLKHAPGILAHSVKLPPLTRVVHDAPGGLSFKQMADGSVVGTDAPNPPDIPAHHDIRDHAMPFPDQALVQMHGKRILAKIGAFLPDAKNMSLERLTLGFRPIPMDEFPVMGALPKSPDVHVAVTHSGVTLAPIIGRYTAEEVLKGNRVQDFAPYRIERFG